MDYKTKKDLESLNQILEHLEPRHNNTGDIDVAITIVKDWIKELRRK